MSRGSPDVADLIRANELLLAELAEVRSANQDLARRLVEAQVGSKSDRATHRAALNLLEDAVLAREAARRENEERQRVEAELRDASRRKDEFLATLAHELRNPLAPVVNSLQILRGRPVDPSIATRVYGMIDRQVQHMTRLVDDLLDVSRITRGNVELKREAVEVEAIVAASLETVRPTIEAAEHELTVTLPSAPVAVYGDRVRLAQVLGNLLANASKYTDPPGKIALEVRSEPPNVVISVRDTGHGIPPGMLERVFDLFTQVDRTYDRRQGGLGIGLTLVRSLVELHGGTVFARSAGPGQGSEFVVTLPIWNGAVHSDLGPRPQHAALREPRRVLIVDDNRDAAESLALFLDTLGANTRMAHDGEGALATFERFRPHVVLLDIGLPGMDGLEVARRVRSQVGRDVTLIALTGWGQPDDRRRTNEAGFDHHLVKPVDPDALVKLLEAVTAEA